MVSIPTTYREMRAHVMQLAVLWTWAMSPNMLQMAISRAVPMRCLQMSRATSHGEWIFW